MSVVAQTLRALALIGAALTLLIAPASMATALPTASPRAASSGADIVLDPPVPGAVYEDRPTHLSGQLSSHKSGRPVVIERLVNGTWRLATTTRTTDGGSFEVDWTPVEPRTLSLRAALQTRHHRLISAPQPLRVLDRRVFLVSRPSYDTFDPIVLNGTLRPRTADEEVAIQRLVSGHWVHVRGAVTDADGHYAITMPNNRPGAWVVRASWPGERPGHGTSEYSMPHHYVVHATLDPVVTSVTRRQLGGSYHAGCPVGPALLRNVEMTFRTFGPFVGRGTLVVRSTIVGQVTDVFGQALSRGYPIRRMFPTAHYGGSDIASMYHDNTSAFNCRHVTGDPTRLSPHSYGTAVDVDTVENPYQDVSGTWWPRSKGAEYRDRSDPRLGMLYSGSTLTRGFTSRGFQWGGRWSHPDYQHFDPGSGKSGTRARGPSAGPLSVASLPAPTALGPGWRRSFGPAVDESGGTGRASFARVRDAPDAARAVLPLGCRTRAHVPSSVPLFALQGSYVSAFGQPGQAIVLQFATARLATRYFAGLIGSLEACGLADGPGGVSVTTNEVSSSVYNGERHYAAGEQWSERDVRAGTRVTMLLRRTSAASWHSR